MTHVPTTAANCYCKNSAGNAGTSGHELSWQGRTAQDVHVTCVCPVQAVRLESAWSDRVRYMVVVYTSGRQDTEENILLGMDFTNKDWYEWSRCVCVWLYDYCMPDLLKANTIYSIEELRNYQSKNSMYAVLLGCMKVSLWCSSFWDPATLVL